MITSLGPASNHDQLLMGTFLAAHVLPEVGLTGVGEPAQGSYIFHQ